MKNTIRTTLYAKRYTLYAILIALLCIILPQATQAAAAPVCGDGTCDSTETCSACPGDCGECAGPEFPQDYVSWWKFDGNANDETGKNNGTFNGNATTVYAIGRDYSADTNGYALSLDGAGDWVKIPHNAIFNVGNFTISAWINLDKLYEHQTIFSKGYDAYMFTVNNANKLYFEGEINSNRVRANSGSLIVQANTWHHAVIVWNGTNHIFYLDGVSEVGTCTTACNETGNFDINTRTVEIGGNVKGKIDDLMLFNRSLSAVEIQEIYNSQKNFCTGIARCFDYTDSNSCTNDPCSIGGGCQWDGNSCSRTKKNTWYVRPSGGSYGSENGTSYENAWDGLRSVAWGPSGVREGDTLYVCGLHLINYTIGPAIDSYWHISATGTSENTRITIRGDCPGDQGIIWGTHIMGGPLNQWTYEGNDTYSSTSSNYDGFFFEDVTATSWNVLTKAPRASGTLTGTWTFTNGDTSVTAAGNGNALNEVEVGDFVRVANGSQWYKVVAVSDSNTIVINSAFQQATITDVAGATIKEDTSLGVAFVAANPGSYYSPTYRYPDPLYVHTSDNGDPTNRIVAGSNGYTIDLSNTQNDNQYITFKDIEFYVPKFSGAKSYIRWENTKLWYNSLYFRDGSHHIEFIDCDRAYGIGGFGFQDYSAPYITDAPHHITIRGCKIHDIGIEPQVQNSDAEGIGVNGANYMTIENNEFYNVGSAITFYPYTRQTAVNNTVRWNWVHDTHSLGGARDRGIEFNFGAVAADTSGNKVYGNIVGPGVDDVGYRAKYKDEVQFYNNICYKCGTSFYFINHLKPVRVKLRNNISLNPTQNHIWFGSNGNETEYSIDSDYNLFWPISGNQFFFREYLTSNDQLVNFTQWQALSKNGSTFDPHSIVADPLFVDPDNGDFRLRAGSPAIDAGVDVGLTKDIDGNSIPQGAAPDIGAYEYVPQGNILYGDVSGDSEISAYDAALTAQAAVELITLTPEQIQKADVSGEGEVSAYDAALIAQYAVGLIDKFPVE